MTAKELWELYSDKRILILPCPIGAEVYKVVKQKTVLNERCRFKTQKAIFMLDDVPQLGHSVFMTKGEADDVANILNTGR